MTIERVPLRVGSHDPACNLTSTFEMLLKVEQKNSAQKAQVSIMVLR